MENFIFCAGSYSYLLRPLQFAQMVYFLKPAPDNLLLLTDHNCLIGLNTEYLATYVNTDSKSNSRILKRRWIWFDIETWLKSGSPSDINLKLLWEVISIFEFNLE